MVASVEYFSHLHFVHQSFVRRQNQIQYVFTPLPCCLFNMLLQKSVVHHVYKLPIFFPLTFHFLPVYVIVEVPDHHHCFLPYWLFRLSPITHHRLHLSLRVACSKLQLTFSPFLSGSRTTPVAQFLCLPASQNVYLAK